jgi:hypothetical protein
MAKARKQKLKVFRTPTGFHDAYVAAPSRKAALEAWGSATDLFSAGIAEEVRELSGKAAKSALARPGEVMREGRLGGKEGKEAGSRIKSGMTKTRKSAPKPSRAMLEKAEKALAALELRQSLERAELAKEEARLEKKRRALEGKHSQARERAEAKRDAAEQAYREKMRDWL